MAAAQQAMEQDERKKDDDGPPDLYDEDLEEFDTLIHLFTQTEDPTRQMIQVSYTIGHGTTQRRQPEDWILPASWNLQSSSLRSCLRAWH